MLYNEEERQYEFMGGELEKLFPKVYKDVRETDALVVGEQVLFDHYGKKFEEVVNNQYVQTANEEGILRLENIFGITHNPATETTEFRRERIIGRLSMSPPYTINFLKSKLDDVLGKGSYTLLTPTGGRPSDLLPQNVRTFETGWNIGTGSQSTTYKVPMTVFDSGYSTNYFNLNDYITNGTSHSVGLYGRQITLNLLPNTQYIITTNVPGQEGGKNVFALNQGEQASSSVNGVMPSSSLIKTTDSIGKLIIATREVTLAQMQSRGYWITVNKGNVAYSNQLSPQDLHNTSNPVTYNPSADQYVFTERAPLSALENNYCKNELKASDTLVGGSTSWQNNLPDSPKEKLQIEGIQNTVANIQAGTNGSGYYQLVTNFINTLNVGDVYTISVWAKGVGKMSFGVQGDLQVVIDLTEDWKQHTVNITKTSSTTLRAFIMYLATGDSNIFLHSPTLVKGSHAQPKWEKNWEDLPIEEKPVTRIRTIGGTDKNKYTLPVRITPNNRHTHKVVLKNNGTTFYYRVRGIGEEVWDRAIENNGKNDYSQMFLTKGENVTLTFRTDGINDRLDVLAYNPQLFLGEAWEANKEEVPYNTIIVESSVENFQWYEELLVTIGTVKPAHIVYISRPVVASNLSVTEEILISQITHNYRLSTTWRLGQKPFQSMSEGDLIKMTTTKSVNKNLLVASANAIKGTIDRVELTGSNGSLRTINLADLELTVVSESNVFVQVKYSMVAQGFDPAIHKIEVKDASGKVLTSSNVYVPITGDIELTHRIHAKEGN